MAVQLLYFVDAFATGSSHGKLQVNGTAPGVATMGTKADWTTLNASNEFSPVIYNTTQGTGTFGTTTIPASGVKPATNDCFRSETPFSGTFATGSWTVSYSAINTVVGTSGTWNFRVRMWAATSQDGQTNARELTTAGFSSTTFNYTSTTQQNHSAANSPPQVVLKNEYLFIKHVWEKISGSVTVGGTESALVQDGANCLVTTTNFVPDSDVWRRPADRLLYLRR